MLTVKVAAVPLRSLPGQAPRNLEAIENLTRRAAARGAQLVCFPAMAVTGYWRTSAVSAHAEILKVDSANPALIHGVGPSFARLNDISRAAGLSVIAGIVEDHDYYHLRNSVLLFGPNGHVGTAAEVHTELGRHPTFVSGQSLPVFDLPGLRVGLLIGDDVFYPEAARTLVLNGANLLVVCLASALIADRGNAVTDGEDTRMPSLLASRALENGVPVLAVDAAGVVRNEAEQTDYCFPGTAWAFGADGKLLVDGPRGPEDMLVAEVEISHRPTERLHRRRPDAYEPIVRAAAAAHEPQVGLREEVWDLQGSIVWSRLRDLGFFSLDLYDRAVRNWQRRSETVVVTAPSLPPLAGYRVVVLTRPCLARLPIHEAQRLAEWVADHGTLILDGYCGRNAEVLGPLTGVEGALRREVFLPSYVDARRATARIAYAIEHPVFEGMQADQHPKIWGQAWFPDPKAQLSAETLAQIFSPDGERLGGGLYRHAVGRGIVYTWAYSLGYTQLLLTEGRGTTIDLGGFPERVTPGTPRDGDVNTWGDQVVTDAADQYFPSADCHLLPLINILRRTVRDHVLVSPVPAGKECGVIFTGDSDRAGADLVNQYTARLAAHGLRGTQFLCREGYRARELAPDCEYGIHPLFHETEKDHVSVLVSYGLEPEQLVSGRRHCLIQYGLTETLERMADCGIRYTSNNWDFPYAETQSSAFLFGTSLPHHVYNWEGRRIGIVDIPQVFMDYEPILAACRASYRDTLRSHGVGAWNFHPQNQVIPEQVEAIEWLADRVRTDKVWSGTMREYGDWYARRDRLTISTDETGVLIEGDMPEGLTLLSPQPSLMINGTPSRSSRTSIWYGREYFVHLVPEAAGSRHTSPTETSRVTAP